MEIEEDKVKKDEDEAENESTTEDMNDYEDAEE